MEADGARVRDRRAAVGEVEGMSGTGATARTMGRTTRTHTRRLCGCLRVSELRCCS